MKGITVRVAPWLSGWLSGYVERCKAKGIRPDLGLMRMMARVAMGAS